MSTPINSLPRLEEDIDPNHQQQVHSVLREIEMEDQKSQNPYYQDLQFANTMPQQQSPEQVSEQYYEKPIRNYDQKDIQYILNKQSSSDFWIQKLKMPILISILFFLLTLPFSIRLLNRIIPWMVDPYGNASYKGMGIRAGIMGLVIFIIQYFEVM